MFDLTGRTALVTGAGQGVGAELARQLAQQGAAVAVNDIDLQRAKTVAAAIGRHGGASVAVAGDVCHPAQVELMVDEISGALGAVDILVNNAGVPSSGVPYRPFVETQPVEWQGFVDLNLYGVMLCTRAVLQPMIDRRWGRVVTIVSEAGRIGQPGAVAYAAAKGGAAAFSRSLALEVGRFGVTCNALSLGAIRSERDYSSPDLLAKVSKRYPVGRIGEAEDIAAALIWVASEEASWVTGQTFAVNGGYATS